jgi:hypothetical protein
VQEGIAAGASYSHFVEVLEKVRGYLKPIMEAVLFKPDDLDKKTDVKTNHTAKGMFDVLGVYTLFRRIPQRSSHHCYTYT